MSVPRVLLLASGLPNEQDGGQAFLRELCQHYPRSRLCRFSTAPKMDDKRPIEWLGFPIDYAHQSREAAIRRLGPSIARFSSLALHLYIRSILVPIVTARVIRFARGHQVELVWATLDSPTSIYSSRRVAAALGVPLVVTVWDPPERFVTDLGLDPLTGRLLMQDFTKTLRAAVRCSVISDEMQREYKTRYGIDSIVVRYGIDAALRQAPRTRRVSPSQFTIACAGNLYATQAWGALLSALTSIDWCLDGRDVTVRLLGGCDIRLQAPGRMRIEYLGWRSQQEMLALISEADVAYLPYWFDESHTVAAHLSFPAKLSSYLAAGVPVLFHGPEASSPVHFLRRFPAGRCCHSLEASPIIESLRLAGASEFRTSAAQAARKALDEELDRSISLSRFAALIGIEPTDLLPPGRDGHLQPMADPR